MKKLTLSLILLFLAAGVSAHSFDINNMESGNMDHYREEINIYSGSAPSFLESIVGDQTVNVKIESNETEREVGVKLNGTMVQDIQLGGFENATLEVETTETQINAITTSEEPLKQLNQRVQNGEIEYTSNGTVNSIRTFIAEQLLSIASLL